VIPVIACVYPSIFRLKIVSLKYFSPDSVDFWSFLGRVNAFKLILRGLTVSGKPELGLKFPQKTEFRPEFQPSVNSKHESNRPLDNGLKKGGQFLCSFYSFNFILLGH
jgi:hypothetical protein